ncbi:MAG: prolipoprotein diacylglyceryl transferase [Bacilli bacterium]|nr:prolipoprotein diacylglyceryl transferase [Bacilli bacterium]
MCPDLFGIEDFSYILLIAIGIATSIFWIVFYFKRRNYSRNAILDIIACTFFTIALGIVGAMLFQNLYDLIKDPQNYTFTFSMTFYGGLIVGVIVFILLYIFYLKKHDNILFEDVVKVAPICITSAHAFGRIGCFLAGCCYGKHTDSWIGIEFPVIGKRIPTQLIEAIFLFVLTGILFFLIFKAQFKYTLHVYMAAYSIFRFIIEFFRGDDGRGGTLLGLYPSQVICVLIWIIFVPTLLILRKYVFNKPIEDDKE